MLASLSHRVVNSLWTESRVMVESGTGLAEPSRIAWLPVLQMLSWQTTLVYTPLMSFIGVQWLASLRQSGPVTYLCSNPRACTVLPGNRI